METNLALQYGDYIDNAPLSDIDSSKGYKLFHFDMSVCASSKNESILFGTGVSIIM